MSGASTSASSRTPDVDPDAGLDRLVPPGSRTRRVAVAVVTLALLVGAWYSPPLLRPSLPDGRSSGAWQVEEDGTVLGAVRLVPDAWPSVQFRSVDDVPGARAVGAWVRPEPDEAWGGLFGTAGQLDDPSALPRTVPGRRPVVVTVRWEVTDCDLLVEGVRPAVRLRSAVGTATTAHLPSPGGPAPDLGTLIDGGVCPG